MGRVSVHGGGEAEKPFVTGTYKGTTTASQRIELGFEPSCVIVWREDGAQFYNFNGSIYVVGGMALKGAPCKSGGSYAISIYETGFTVYSSSLIRVNDDIHYYIALR